MRKSVKKQKNIKHKTTKKNKNRKQQLKGGGGEEEIQKLIDKEFSRVYFWNELSAVQKPEAIAYLQQNQEDIVWETLCENPLPEAVELLKQNMDKITDECWQILATNPNTNAVNMVIQKVQSDDNNGIEEYLCENTNPAAISFIQESINKYGEEYLNNELYWTNLSKNPAAISLLQQYPDKINWYALCENPTKEAILLLKQNLPTLLENKTMLDWKKISKNPHFPLLFEETKTIPKDILNKIEWHELAEYNSNPDAIAILEKNMNNIVENAKLWDYLSMNPNPKAVKMIIASGRLHENLCKNTNTDALNYVKQHSDIYNIGYLCKNPNPVALEIVKTLIFRQRYYNDSNLWNDITKNPAAVSWLFTEQKEYGINWDKFSENPNAPFSLLEKYQSKINLSSVLQYNKVMEFTDIQKLLDNVVFDWDTIIDNVAPQKYNNDMKNWLLQKICNTINTIGENGKKKILYDYHFPLHSVLKSIIIYNFSFYVQKLIENGINDRLDLCSDIYGETNKIKIQNKYFFICGLTVYMDNNLNDLKKTKKTTDEMISLKYYKGAGYTPINFYLKNMYMPSSLQKKIYMEDVNEIKKHVKNIDNFINDKGEAADKKFVVYRGFRRADAEIENRINYFFLSTTTDYSVARQFAKKQDDGSFCCIIKYIVKSGVHFYNFKDAENESEILFPRGLISLPVPENEKDSMVNFTYYLDNPPFLKKRNILSI